MKTIQEAESALGITTNDMKRLCRQYHLHGEYVEYRPTSKSELSGLYFVLGDADKVKEVAANADKYADNDHVDPAWISTRAIRNPEYFYTDVFSFNMSSAEPLIAIDKISQYAAHYEAIHTIFQEYQKNVPKKIKWPAVATIESLNKGRDNKNYTNAMQKDYGAELGKYLSKNFDKPPVYKEQTGNFVPLEYFEKNDADIKFVNLKEEAFQSLSRILKENLDKYKDIKIYAGKKHVIDIGSYQPVSNTEYNPYAGEQTHFEDRSIAYRNADEGVIGKLIIQDTVDKLLYNVKLDYFANKRCFFIAVPFSYIKALDGQAQKDGFNYCIDKDSIYGKTGIDSFTVLCQEKDYESFCNFISGCVATSHDNHIIWNGQYEWVCVYGDNAKNKKEVLLEDRIEDAKNKQSLLNKIKDIGKKTNREDDFEH